MQAYQLNPLTSTIGVLPDGSWLHGVPNGAHPVVPTTDNLMEGKTNLYFTKERAELLFKAMLSEYLKGAPIEITPAPSPNANPAVPSDYLDLQAKVNTLSLAVSSALSSLSTDEGKYIESLSEIKVSLAQKANLSDVLAALSAKIGINEMLSALEGYVTSDEFKVTNSNVEKVSKAVEDIKELLGAVDGNITLENLVKNNVPRKEFDAYKERWLEALAEINNGLSSMASIEFVDKLVKDNKVNPETFASKAELALLSASIPTAVSQYIAKNPVSAAIDLTPYATHDSVDTKLGSLNAGLERRFATLVTREEHENVTNLLLPASSTSNGLMSKTDKAKLDSFPPASHLALGSDLDMFRSRLSTLEATLVSANRQEDTVYVTPKQLESAVSEVKAVIPKYNLSQYALETSVRERIQRVDGRIAELESKLGNTSGSSNLAGFVTNESFRSLAQRVEALSAPTSPQNVRTDHLATRVDLDLVRRTVNLTNSSLSTKLDVHAHENAYREMSLGVQQKFNTLSNRLEGLTKRVDLLAGSSNSGGVVSTIGEDVLSKYALRSDINTVDGRISALNALVSGKDAAYIQRFQDLERSFQAGNGQATAKLNELQAGQRSNEILLNTLSKGLESVSSSLPSYAPLSAVKDLSTKVEDFEGRISHLKPSTVSEVTARLDTLTNQVSGISTQLSSAPKGYITDGAGKPFQLATVNYVTEAIADAVGKSGSNSSSTVNVPSDLSIAIQQYIPKRATSSLAGIVRLATQEEVRVPDTVDGAVPSLADVVTVIKNQPTASAITRGFMSPQQAAKLENALVQSDITNIENAFSIRVQDHLSSVQSALTRHEQSNLSLSSRVSTLEQVSSVDLTPYATNVSVKSLENRITDRINRLSLVSQDDVNQAVLKSKAEIVQGYTDAVAVVSRRLDTLSVNPSPSGGFATVDFVNSTNSSLRGELSTVTGDLNSATVKLAALELSDRQTRQTVQSIEGRLGNLETSAGSTTLSSRLDALDRKIPDLVTKEYLASQLSSLPSGGSGGSSVSDSAINILSESQERLKGDVSSVTQRVTSLEGQVRGFSTLVSSSVQDKISADDAQNRFVAKTDYERDKSGFVSTSLFNSTLSEYAKKSEITQSSPSQDLSSYATTESVTQAITKAKEGLVTTENLTATLQPYAKSEALAGYVQTATLSDYVQTTALNDYATKQHVTQATADFVTQSSLTEKLRGKMDTVDLGTYALKTEVPTLSPDTLSPHLTAYATKESLNDYAKAAEVPTRKAVKQEASEGKHKVNLSEFNGRFVGLTLVLRNEGGEEANLTGVTVSLDSSEVYPKMAATIGAGKFYRIPVTQPLSLGVTESTELEINIEGGSVSLITIVDVLY